MQQRIIENSKATFVNCDNHSPNLAGVHTASEEPVTVTFFGTVDELYSFFSPSLLQLTMRWDRLTKAMPVKLKSQSERRWSAREEAIKQICLHFDELVNLLEDMSTDLKKMQIREK